MIGGLMDAPTLILQPALMSDGTPFPTGNLWWPQAPDGRSLPELTTPQAMSLAAREGWQIHVR
jgi:hypothetical protein